MGCNFLKGAHGDPPTPFSPLPDTTSEGYFTVDEIAMGKLRSRARYGDEGRRIETR
jgi:hypothetical protein